MAQNALDLPWIQQFADPTNTMSSKHGRQSMRTKETVLDNFLRTITLSYSDSKDSEYSG